MSRIVAGVARGRRISMPKGQDTRPTSDRVREALFGSLTAEFGSLTGIGFLDLYAGSGAVGLEALSRGARPVWLVESNREAAGVIRQNLRVLDDLRTGVTVRVGAVRRVVGESAPAVFDVAFLDPPYARSGEALAQELGMLVEHGWLAAEAVVVVERATRSGEFDWPGGFTPYRERRYGDTTLWYARTG